MALHCPCRSAVALAPTSLVLVALLLPTTARAISSRIFIAPAGATISDHFGQSVAHAGDVNGDGYPDVIVGAPLNSAGGAAAGRAYVYFGGPNADAVADWTLTGSVAGGQFGLSVAGAGDLNGDGFDDVIVGTPYNVAADAGAAYVFFGGASPNTTVDLTFTGSASLDRFGYSVAGAGDLNGDGFDDVIVGAWGNDNGGSSAGAAYLYYGAAIPDQVVDLTLTGLAADDQFGLAVGAAGDVNGDGAGVGSCVSDGYRGLRDAKAGEVRGGPRHDDLVGVRLGAAHAARDRAEGGAPVVRDREVGRIVAQPADGDGFARDPALPAVG